MVGRVEWGLGVIRDSQGLAGGLKGGVLKGLAYIDCV